MLLQTSNDFWLQIQWMGSFGFYLMSLGGVHACSTAVCPLGRQGAWYRIDERGWLINMIEFMWSMEKRTSYSDGAARHGMDDCVCAPHPFQGKNLWFQMYAPDETCRKRQGTQRLLLHSLPTTSYAQIKVIYIVVLLLPCTRPFLLGHQ